MPNRPLSGETDSAVEQLLLKKNGERKTVSDIFEIVVAMNHDRKADTRMLLSEIQNNRLVVERHLTEDVRMTNEEFREFIAGFAKKHEQRDLVVSAVSTAVDKLEADLSALKDTFVKLHTRAPRRATDPPTEEWGRSVFGGNEDEEIGDIRRFWRVGKWFVVVAVSTSIVILGEELATLLFGAK